MSRTQILSFWKTLKEYERAGISLWARDLIGQVNWNSETYDLPTTPRMTCLATSVRPYVFAKLRQRKEYNFREFLDRVYSVLGQEELRATQETTQITEFIEQVSNWILSYLNSQNPVVV